MSDSSRASGTAQSTQSTTVWPRQVTGPQALEKVRSYLRELQPLVDEDPHFKSGVGSMLAQQMPEAIEYLRIAGDWFGNARPDQGGGGRAYPTGGGT